ncbi:sigma-70 family RNA polymerase sigma factor [archaeon]|jgi:hypothetical protein|nr:sigma-70 family RNA polymerase sigma factor [archaeon]MBT3731279.1 sigma-70 family RNA polymerase sigma factor [archaeon]MBT4669932.1 sigma-70 family RNA polymerase sigma factor [archaeon]MBT5029757.1 sigma-70 family RNA polymerase sigma factor [archaeon]MBT5287494.1 sigma-70 family RNA polymerase sigma factor [archaeon]
MELEAFESIIKARARRYASTPSEIEDYAQEARIVAWQALQRDADDQKAYVRTAINNSMRNTQEKERAQKRNPRGGLSYLSQTVSDSDERRLENFVGEEDMPIGREFVESVKENLRSRYGRNYIQGLQVDERYPKNTIRKIIRTVIEEVEEIPFGEIPEKVNKDFFKERGMISFLNIFYSGSPYMAVNDAYFNQILPWEWSRVPKNYWQTNLKFRRARDAVAWFAKKRDIFSIEDCGTVIGDDFRNEGLGGMLHQVFNDSTFLALKMKFPELRPWNMKYSPKGSYDKKEFRINALNDYLISQGAIPLDGLSPEETYDQIGLRNFLTKSSIKDFGLFTLLNRYGRSIYRMFEDNFPEQILPWTIKNVKYVWEDNPKETAVKAVKWLIEDYLQLEEEEIPQHITQDLFRRLKLSRIIKNERVGFRGSPFEAVNAAYPNVFSLDDFRRGRKTVRINLEGKTVA